MLSRGRRDLEVSGCLAWVRGASPIASERVLFSVLSPTLLVGYTERDGSPVDYVIFSTVSGVSFEQPTTIVLYREKHDDIMLIARNHEDFRQWFDAISASLRFRTGDVALQSNGLSTSQKTILGTPNCSTCVDKESPYGGLPFNSGDATEGGVMASFPRSGGDACKRFSLPGVLHVPSAPDDSPPAGCRTARPDDVNRKRQTVSTRNITVGPRSIFSQGADASARTQNQECNFCSSPLCNHSKKCCRPATGLSSASQVARHDTPDVPCDVMDCACDMSCSSSHSVAGKCRSPRDVAAQSSTCLGYNQQQTHAPYIGCSEDELMTDRSTCVQPRPNYSATSGERGLAAVGVGHSFSERQNMVPSMSLARGNPTPCQQISERRQGCEMLTGNVELSGHRQVPSLADPSTLSGNTLNSARDGRSVDSSSQFLAATSGHVTESCRRNRMKEVNEAIVTLLTNVVRRGTSGMQRTDVRDPCPDDATRLVAETSSNSCPVRSGVRADVHPSYSNGPQLRAGSSDRRGDVGVECRDRHKANSSAHSNVQNCVWHPRQFSTDNVVSSSAPFSRKEAHKHGRRARDRSESGRLAAAAAPTRRDGRSMSVPADVNRQKTPRCTILSVCPSTNACGSARANVSCGSKGMR
uniref:PH-like domain-containing protein n=1 Tax=Trypanosoma vivax (strain Y486) TaxID=1055687 RepID=G0U366_TRYVY|nr:conserved hypothetical protein [Trypanosoma vivax Y486]